jgi:hypothetical protein
MMTFPRVSVLMTVYNGGAYLREAVESVLASTLTDFEFVIVDNGSTDGSRDYLRSLTDPRIRLIENERNLGQTGALNVGLRACNAPYVARLDADDIMLPDRLGEQAAALDADSLTALVGGQMIAVDENGRHLFRTRYPIDSDSITARMLLQNCFDHSSVMFRRDTALALGGYPEDHAVSQDYALFSAFMRAGGKLRNTASVAAKVRMHAGQVMAQGGQERELPEAVRITAANQAWAAKRPEDRGLARTLLRLWSGRRADGTAVSDPDPPIALKTFFEQTPLSSRQAALLSMFLLGGPCDGRLDVRLKLFATALKRYPLIVMHPEFGKRLARAVLPHRHLGRFRNLTSMN